MTVKPDSVAGSGFSVPSWRTSSRSASNGGQCVEVGAAWRTSSRSTNNGGHCVEVGPLLDRSGLVAVRDSKDRSIPAMVLPAADWSALLNDLRA